MKAPIRRMVPRHLPKRGEEGFGLVEVLVASVVILILMLSVGALLIDSLSSVAYAGQNQGADHLLDKTIEEIRALPFSTLQSGLYKSDVSGDPAITNSAGVDYYKGQRLLESTAQPPAPLDPHQTTVRQSSTSAGSYTVDVYPTMNPALGGGSGAVVVTVVVSWNRAAKPGLADSVTGQTVVYSPSAGCLAPTDHPFAAPCQPFLYADAATGGGGITITPDPSVANGMSTALTSAQMVAPRASVDLQSEQITSVSSSATPPGYIYTQGSTQTEYGGTAVNSYADDDPGTSSSHAYATNSGPTTAASAPTLTAPNNVTLGFSDSAGAGSATATAATAAGSGQLCHDLSGASVSTGLACGDASAGTGTGPAQTATVGVPVGGTTADLGVAALSESVSAFAGRAVAPGASFCTTTTGDGCVHAGTSRSAFTLGLGGVPAGLMSPPPNWNGSLITIGVADSTSAESGVNPAAPTAGPAVTVNAYEGGKYVPLASGVLPAGPLTVSGVVGGQTLAVSLTLEDLTIGAPNHTSTGCSATCESGTIGSPIIADMNYQVTVAGTEVFGATIHVDLGTESSSTTYKAAPLAG